MEHAKLSMKMHSALVHQFKNTAYASTPLVVLILMSIKVVNWILVIMPFKRVICLSILPEKWDIPCVTNQLKAIL